MDTANPVTESELATQITVLTESLIDAQRLLAAEDRGWSLATGDTGWSLDEQRTWATLARSMVIGDPLIKRAMTLRVAYVWGDGVTISATTGDDEGTPDVNTVVQGFLDDQKVTFSGTQAREDAERAFGCDGNLFYALPTDPVTGRVQVRRVPLAQIVEVITNPDDTEEPWFYKRRAVTVTVKPFLPVGGPGVLRTTTTEQFVYHPALGFNPEWGRVDEMDGVRVDWSTPVLHARVNRPDTGQFGCGDLWAALKFARGYKGFLEDWARLVKALSRFAFRATSPTKAGAGQVRAAVTASPDGVGGVVTTSPDQKFEAIGKSGATIDSESGRPLAAMVAAATDLPVTMLLADPGVTGARATAETLDRPTERIFNARRDVHGQIINAVLHHVIDSAIDAPKGPLHGQKVDDRGLVVDWPDMSTVPMDVMVKALVSVKDMDVVPLDDLARLVLVTLGVDNVDEILSKVMDDEGNFMPPSQVAGDVLGSVAAQAFRDGRDPASALNQ